MKYTLAAVIAAVISLSVCVAFSIPKPATASAAWQLQIHLNELQTIRLKVPGADQPQTFWFLRYTVTNETGEDRIFVPQFELYTDTGEFIRAGKDVPPQVFAAIKRTFNDPLLKSHNDIGGQILQGEDNAKNGVAIFKAFDPQAGSVDVFVGGLSGETQEIALPDSAPADDGATTAPSKVTLTKTLMLEYMYPSDPSAKQARGKMTLTKKSWVMR